MNESTKSLIVDVFLIVVSPIIVIGLIASVCVHLANPVPMKDHEAIRAERDLYRRVLVENKLAEWRGEPGQVPDEFHIIEDKEGK